MSTAHEVLAEVKATRVSEQTEEAEQKKLFGRCWSPRYMLIIAAVWGGLACVHVGLLFAQQLKDPSQSRVSMVVTALVNVMMALAVLYFFAARRNAAINELIRQKAPDLHEELKERRVL